MDKRLSKSPEPQISQKITNEREDCLASHRSSPILSPAPESFSSLSESATGHVQFIQANGIRISGGKREKLCLRCETWINLGLSENMTPLENHQRGKTCIKNTAKLQRQREEQAANEARMSWQLSTTSLPVSVLNSSKPRALSLRSPFQIRSKSIPTRMLDPMDFRPSSASVLSHSRVPKIPVRDLQHQSRPPSPCPGIKLVWPQGSIYTTYPFQIHEYTPKRNGFHFCFVSDDGLDFYVKSTICTGSTPRADGLACGPCGRLVSVIEKLHERALHPPKTLNYAYLNQEQLKTALEKKDAVIAQLTVQRLNVVRDMSVATRRLDDNDRFLRAIVDCDLPRLQQLIKTAWLHGASKNAIIERIKLTLQGLKNTRGYTSKEFQITTLLYRLGGSSLVQSCSVALNLPTLNTLRVRSDMTHLKPTLGEIRSEEIEWNISSLFQDTKDSTSKTSMVPIPRCGHSILMDEICLDERAVFMKAENSVGGLCREHTTRDGLVISSFSNLEHIANSVHGLEPTAHYGKEATVAGIAPFRLEDYDIRPVLVSATCKSDTAVECIAFIQKIIDAWRTTPEGEAKHGPIWSVASDGDATRRKAFYDLFMKIPLSSSNPLFKILSPCIGLNLSTGKNNVTADFDPKHIAKRTSTCLRSNEGMLVFDVSINRLILAQYLVKLPGQTSENVYKLLNPADPQDVPRAIELINAVAELRTLETTEFSPSEKNTFKALSTIGYLFHSLMAPFLDRELSLTEQITSLSQYSHLAFLLYRRHVTAFISNQLYGDSQTMVKNALFYVAKQQSMDPTASVFLMLTGDDRLENLFGKVRMQGGHDTNVDIKSLTHRLCAAMDIIKVYRDNPSWDPGHRRLQYTRLEHLDHLKPGAWKGDLVAANCDVKSAWAAGRLNVEHFLDNLHLPHDFASAFSQPNVDILRPFPDGKYPGVATDNDRSQITKSSSDVDTLHAVATKDKSCSYTIDISLPLDSTSEIIDVDDDSDHDDSDEDHNLEAHESLLLPGESVQEFFDTGPGDEDVDREPTSEELEALELEGLASPWLEVDGKMVHIASLMRKLFSSDLSQKSHERLGRIRGFTRDFSGPGNDDPNNVIGVSLFVLGDLFTTLVCMNSRVSLAVLQTNAIEQKGKRVASVNEAEIALESAGIVVFGQVLHLVSHATMRVEDSESSVSPSNLHPHLPSPSESDSSTSFSGSTLSTHQSQVIAALDTPSTVIASPSDVGSTETPALNIPANRLHPTDFDVVDYVYWSGDLVKFKPLKSKTDGPQASLKNEKISRNSVTIRVPSDLIRPVNGCMCDRLDLLPVEAEPLDSHGIQNTWVFNLGILEGIMKSLWDKAKSEKLFAKIPKVGPSHGSQFPYNVSRLIVEEDSTTIAKETSKSPCYVCKKPLPRDPGKRRTHVGIHILKWMRNVPEAPLRGSPPLTPVGRNPCGFCGKTTDEGGCSSTVTVKGKTTSASSTCPEFSPFVYKKALVPSASTPSTNVPIVCQLCPHDHTAGPKPAIWSYNMPEHIKVHHPGHSFPSQVSPEFLKLFVLSYEEEIAMGIPKEQISTLPSSAPITNTTTLQRTSSKRKATDAPALSIAESQSISGPGTSTSKRPRVAR